MVRRIMHAIGMGLVMLMYTALAVGMLIAVAAS